MLSTRRSFLALAAGAVTPLMVRSAQRPGNGKLIGVESAPIRIDLYIDFQSPLCRALHVSIEPALMSDYVTTGKVYLVHRDFSMPQHPYAKTAASYACGASWIGKYNQVANALFRRQSDWSTSGKVDEVACSVLSADDANRIRALAKDPAIANEIGNDMNTGATEPVTLTPTMVVRANGKKILVPGSPDLNSFRRLLDSIAK